MKIPRHHFAYRHCCYCMGRWCWCWFGWWLCWQDLLLLYVVFPLWFHFMFWLILQKITSPQPPSHPKPKSGCSSTSTSNSNANHQPVHSTVIVPWMWMKQLPWNAIISRGVAIAFTSPFDWFLTMSVRPSVCLSEIRFRWFHLNKFRFLFSKFSIFVKNSFELNLWKTPSTWCCCSSIHISLPLMSCCRNKVLPRVVFVWIFGNNKLFYNCIYEYK